MQCISTRVSLRSRSCTQNACPGSKTHGMLVIYYVPPLCTTKHSLSVPTVLPLERLPRDIPPAQRVPSQEQPSVKLHVASVSTAEHGALHGTSLRAANPIRSCCLSNSIYKSFRRSNPIMALFEGENAVSLACSTLHLEVIRLQASKPTTLRHKPSSLTFRMQSLSTLHACASEASAIPRNHATGKLRPAEAPVSTVASR
mmetsp:Transcript_55324/g.142476  ORF Transcript_55324/g.142476 Transcript_55324/m.142476 type:complete len:200 (-) Transcript_55324:108-707(-)